MSCACRLGAATCAHPHDGNWGWVAKTRISSGVAIVQSWPRKAQDTTEAAAQTPASYLVFLSPERYQLNPWLSPKEVARAVKNTIPVTLFFD